MSNLLLADEWAVRAASCADIYLLASHHRKMFEEIWEQKGEPLGIQLAGELEKAYIQKLETGIEAGLCKAWLIEDSGIIVASGAVTFVDFVPSPLDLSSRVAYLHSVYTEKSHRKKGCAQRIVRNIIEYCKMLNIKRVFLNASDAGMPVYQKMGFRCGQDTMRLVLE